jgi:hypothetical protein
MLRLWRITPSLFSFSGPQSRDAAVFLVVAPLSLAYPTTFLPARMLFSEELNLVSYIASFLPFKSACMLGQVNRLCAQHVGDIKHVRYEEILRACPWLSEPRALQVRMPRKHDDLQGKMANTEGMRWGFGPADTLVVRIDGQTFTTPIYPDQAFRVTRLPDYEFDTTTQHAFQAVSAATGARLHAFGIVEGSDNIGVADLNPHVQVARWPGCSGWALSFFARADTRHLFHIGHMLTDCHPAFLSRPGELWIPDARDIGIVWYFGPRPDRLYRDTIGPHLFPAQTFARRGDIPAAIAALKGHEIDTHFEFHETLLLACAKHHAQWGHHHLDMLLQAGADINAFDEDDETALSLSIQRGNAAQVATLLERGATNLLGTLSKAIIDKVPHCSEVAATLIARGSDVNERYPLLQNTPLMLAVTAGLPDVVDTLLECGADPLLRNYHGKQAIDLVAAHEDAKAIYKRLSAFIE